MQRNKKRVVEHGWLPGDCFLDEKHGVKLIIGVADQPFGRLTVLIIDKGKFTIEIVARSDWAFRMDEFIGVDDLER